MAYELPKEALEYIDAHREELVELVKTLTLIPSPSRKEDKRAAFCKQWLDNAGAKGVYIDEAKNVIFPVNAEGSNQLTLFAAHMDTVFPDLEPMPLIEKDGKIFSPGVGDDTASVAITLMIGRYVVQQNLKPKDGWLLVCNSCEEADGNQAGVKQIMKDFAGRIKEAYMFDGLFNNAVNWPVALVSYKVKVTAQGGHAYLAFGNSSAIQGAASIITDLYSLKIPAGCKSSYNVGLIKAGTSVNAIAETAELTVEMRSELSEVLEGLQAELDRIFQKHRDLGYQVDAEIVATTPGKKGVDPEKQKVIDDKLRILLARHCDDGEPIFRSGCGDLNIPMSMGVPGIGFCGYIVKNVHSRDEWIDVASLQKGFALNMAVALSCL